MSDRFEWIERGTGVIVDLPLPGVPGLVVEVRHSGTRVLAVLPPRAVAELADYLDGALDEPLAERLREVVLEARQLEDERDTIIAERDAARAEVEQLTERVAQLTELVERTHVAYVRAVTS